MASMIQRLHRVLVDRIAETPWLRGRSGARAAWAHYERHARAWTASADRHAAARSNARARARALHDRSRERAQRLASHGQARLLPRWQAAIGRVTAAVANRGRNDR
jgi:hypothetical protein